MKLLASTEPLSPLNTSVTIEGAYPQQHRNPTDSGKATGIKLLERRSQGHCYAVRLSMQL